MLRDRDRPFILGVLGAILSGCLARVPAWASCPMTFTFRSSPGPASGARRSMTFETWTVTDDWPDAVPITDAELDVFEAWFGDVFDELLGPCR